MVADGLSGCQGYFAVTCPGEVLYVQVSVYITGVFGIAEFGLIIAKMEFRIVNIPFPLGQDQIVVASAEIHLVPTQPFVVRPGIRLDIAIDISVSGCIFFKCDNCVGSQDDFPVDKGRMG